jgi:ferredoxin
VSDDITSARIGDLTVSIDRPSCIGSGNCVKVAPTLFRLDDESIAAFAATSADTPRDVVLEACRICPVEALRVTDKDGAELVP